MATPVPDTGEGINFRGEMNDSYIAGLNRNSEHDKFPADAPGFG